MAKRTTIEDLRSGVEVVTMQGRRYMAVARATVDGVSSVLIGSGTSYWVPASEVSAADASIAETNRNAIAAYLGR
ncbi:MAG: hypothetical protein M0Z66_15995 [Thermaerobacter sp.]|nr:hypothetical protein [Thermaerobacter sp.]